VRSLVVTDSLIWTAETEYALSVARAESDSAWDVTLAAPRESAACEAAGTDIRLLELPGRDPGRSPADLLADIRFLSSLARKERFDVVHSSRSPAHVAAALAVGRTAPLVHLRGGAQRPRSSALNRFLYGRMTAAVIASSDRIRRWVVDGLGVPATRVHRILAPVDVGRFAGPRGGAAIRKELGIDVGAPLVVNVARLAPVKGQHLLVEAFARVAAERPDAVLLLVGEPWSGEPAGVLTLSERLGVGASVVALGRRDDVPDIVAEANVCVSASIGSEENSRAVSEYMAAGRPVVATRVGVVPELVAHGVTGLLVEPGAPAELSSSILELLGAPDRASAMGREAAAFAEENLSRSAFGCRVSSVLSQIGAGA